MSFADPDYKDMGHFLALVREKTKDEALRGSAGRLLDYLTGTLVAANAASGKYQPARGVSFYFPEDSFDPDFYRLKFAKDINWTGCALLGK